MLIPFLAAITRTVILFLPSISATLSFFALRNAIAGGAYGDEDISPDLALKIRALFEKYNAPHLKHLPLKKISPAYTEMFLAQGKPMVTDRSMILLNEEFVAALPDAEFEALMLQTAAYYLHNVMRTWLLINWIVQALLGVASLVLARYVGNCTFLPTTFCVGLEFMLRWNIIAVLAGPLISDWYFAYENTRFSFRLAQQSGHIPGYINLYSRLYEQTKLPIFLKKLTYFQKHG